MDATTASEIITSVGVAQSLGARMLATVRGLRQRSDTDRAVGDSSTRTCVYLEFQSALTQLLLDLHLLAGIGIPPSISGALWSWPIAFRAQRDVRDGMRSALGSLTAISLLASASVHDAGFRASELAAEAAEAFPDAKSSHERFEASVDRAQEALRDFIEAARAELLASA